MGESTVLLSDQLTAYHLAPNRTRKAKETLVRIA